MKNLLIETNLFEGRVNEDSSGRTLVKGVLQRSGAENQNGRVYPRGVLEREIDKYQTLIKERRALGELDHPDSSVINLKNVSHNIKEVHWEGNDVIGTVEILPTPSGNILKELLRAGILLGISSRGMGSVETVDEGDGEQPSMKVGQDFELIAFDFVSNPSTHGAFMHPLTEGVDKIQTQGRTCGTYCKAEELINQIIRGE